MRRCGWRFVAWVISAREDSRASIATLLVTAHCDLTQRRRWALSAERADSFRKKRERGGWRPDENLLTGDVVLPAGTGSLGS
jgi:hypothetical protein